MEVVPREAARNLQNTAVRDILLSVQLFICKLGFGEDVAQLKLDKKKLSAIATSDVEQILFSLEEFVKQLQEIEVKLKSEIKDLSVVQFKKPRVDEADNNQIKAARGNQFNPISGVYQVDWSLVQVTADKKEINRRISSFIERKQSEVDQLNRREFCNVVESGQGAENSCARTEAVFVPRLGQKSHIKVTRVDNTTTSDETQTLDHVTGLQGTAENRKNTPRAKLTCTNTAVMERVHNMEQFLGLHAGEPVAPDIYEKLQQLENRILCLEGMSPEYFHLKDSLGTRRGLSNTFESGASSSLHSQQYETMSLDAIEERIKILRNSLQKKRP